MRRSFSILVLTFVISVFSLFAQSFTSSITGTVSDPTGAVVPAAHVALKNMATNDLRETTSKSDGTYQFNNLQPGTYQITVTAAGFRSHVQDNLILQAQIASTVNISLEIGGVEQKVEVSSSAVLVDTQTANNATTLDSQLLSALPNATRNPLNFVFALAGTTPAPAGSGQTQTNGTFDQMSSNFGLNGGRTGNESILIDGAPSQAVDWGGLMVAPLQDSVQEQQVVVNTYDAQYERAGGGIVTLVTKNGTEQFHGEAYDYLQNSFLNANYWVNNRYGVDRGQFKQNQFGGNFGGPILKRAHLFFFGGYEGLRQPNTQSVGPLTVPTQAERNGDFSQTYNVDGSLRVIYNPFSTVALDPSSGTFTRDPFPNNQIPSSLLNPVGQKIANLYPLPNRPGTGPEDLNNYYAQGAGYYENDKFDVRVDWEQSSTHRLFVRVSDRVRQSQNVPCFFCNGGDFEDNQANTGVQAVINDTITPGPNWVINSFVSYSRWRESHTGVGYGQGNASEIGLDPSLFQAPLLPVISDNDGFYTGLGSGTFQRYTRYSDTAEVNITHQFTKHTLKFGANFDIGMINSISEAAGSFGFSSALTSCDPDPNGGPCQALNYGSSVTGNTIASMLLGTASGGGQGINIDPAMSLHTYGVYLQDQWRITPRLTINAGLRYENQRPATERYNRVEYFDPNVVNPISSVVSSTFGHDLTGGFVYANADHPYEWHPDNSTFAPRMGIAYRITDKLVMRAGAGIFFLQPSALISFDNPGQTYGFSSSTPYIATLNNGYTPANLVSNPFPNGINQPTGGSLGLYTLVGDGQSQIWPYSPHPIGYTEQWSFDLQYQLNPHSIIEASYTGNRGRKLLYGNPNLDADTLPEQYLGLQSQLDALVPNPFYNNIPQNPNTYLNQSPTIAYNELLRPYPQFTYLVWTRSLPGASSQFDALNVKYNYAFHAGLSLLATYQWSKAMDNGPEDYFGWAFSAPQWRDPYNTKLDYNISTHDIPQSFTTALVYDLPYGKGKTWGSNAPTFVRQVFGNWQISSIVRLASGLPLQSIFWSYSNQLNNYGYQGPQLADWLSKDVSPANRTPNQWINAAAFGPPAGGDWTFGNTPQRMTQLRERAFRNIDFSIAKAFDITERWKAQLRGEALNLTNYAQYTLSSFNDFARCVTCGDFGDLDGQENIPRTVQLSLKVIF